MARETGSGNAKRRTPAGGADPATGNAPPPATGPWVDAGEALRAHAREIHDRLCAEYECPIPFFAGHDPLTQLVGSLLSHRTRNADTGRALRALRARWNGDWSAVRDAPVAEVEAEIPMVNWPEMKAPRIQAVLRRIGELRAGDLSLDFLATMGVPDARRWLEAIPGIGPKTSASVLNFSRLRMPALPVDSHHHRVALRTGLIAPRTSEQKAHALLEAQLPAGWDAQQVYDNHEVLMLHGQRICHWRDPRCERCVLLDICPTGRERAASGAVLPVDVAGGE